MNEKKYYYPELDIVKGIAIIIVICGHTVSDTFDLPWYFQYFLVSFSMPLFMVASGFLFTLKDDWSSFF